VATTAETSLAEDESDVEEPQADATMEDEPGFVDGSEQEQRHLSKAERKRLKKLARMNRAAA
jgi:hypothetical protein